MSETEGPPPGPESEWEPAWDPDTGPQPSQSGPRSHRAPRPLGWVLAPLGAVAVVIIVILLLIWINGRPGGSSSAGGVAGATTGTPPKVVLSTTQSSSPPPTTTSPAPSSTPPATPKTHKPTPSPHKSTPAPHKSSHRPPPAPTAMATVQVLNNSRIHGLAHEVAAEVADKGWHIGFIGNLQGRTPEPTVYFAPGEEAAAKHLALEFSSIRRIEPNSAAGLTSGGITLVLTSAWAD